MNNYFETKDVPLCIDDLVLYDLYMYGIGVDDPNRYPIVRILHINHCISVYFVTGIFVGETWSVSADYVVQVVNGMAPLVPKIHEAA
jgi:hypothetical protein